MIVDDVRPPIVEKVLQQLSDSYQLSGQREGIHCTDAIYCLRKTFWNKTCPLPPAPIESMHFLVGLGLQDTLLGKPSPSPKIRDGIWVSADYLEAGMYLELKTTMMGEKRLNDHDFPEGWIKQLKAYCYVYERHSIVLLVFPLLSKKVLSYVFTFTDEELAENWDWIWTRARELEICLEKSELPKSKGFDFECKDCRYRLRCQVEDSKEEQ